MKTLAYTRTARAGWTLSTDPAHAQAPSETPHATLQLADGPCEVWRYRDPRGRLNKLVCRLHKMQVSPNWQDLI